MKLPLLRTEIAPALRQRHQRMQHIMQFIGVAHIRPGFLPHLRNRRRIQPAHFLEYRFRQHPSHLHRPRPPLLKWSIVKKRIWIRIQNFMRKLRWHRGIDRETTNPSIRQPAQHQLQPVNIHGLGEDILHHLTHQRMIRNLPLTLNIFEASRRIRKNRRQQIIGAHALNLRWNFLSVLKAQQRQSPVRIPTPSRGKDRRIQRRLLQNRLHRRGLQKIKNVSQWKAVLLSQSDVQPVVSSCSLQFEVEPNTETLAQRQSPGLVDAPPKWRVDDKLHSTAFIEEALRNHGRLRWHGTEHCSPLQNVFNRLLRPGIIKSALLFEPPNNSSNFRLCSREADRRSMRQHLTDFFPQSSDVLRKFLSSCRRFPTPERNAG